MKKCEPSIKVIRTITEGYNSIDTQWKNNIFYDKKRSISWENGTMIRQYSNKTVKINFKKASWEKNSIFIIDNAKIQRTDKIVNTIKHHKMLAFIFSLYSLNSKEIRTLSDVKRKVSIQN